MLLVSALVAGLTVGIHAQLLAPLPRVPLPRPAAGAVRVAVNDNRTPAGARAGAVLTLAIDVIQSAWRPEGDTDPEVPIFAFAERGRAPQVPGPLIRVPQGTEVRLVLRSTVDSALVLAGLRPGDSA